MTGRTDFPVAHLTFGVRESADLGACFALFFPDAPKKLDQGPFASGHLDADMPAQLRALADHIERVLGAEA